MLKLETEFETLVVLPDGCIDFKYIYNYRKQRCLNLKIYK
jgi:hypothetical protein